MTDGVIFIGMGGHAKNLIEICEMDDMPIDGYIDPTVYHDKYKRLESMPESANGVVAFGGVTCDVLEQRWNIADKYQCCIFPEMIHPTVIMGKHYCGMGVHIMAGSIIQRNATLESFCIINTGAIIEHDAFIGKGSHIAPGAVVLGDVRVGEFSFIGANAVIVQGSVVPPRTFVKANSVWKS